MTDVSQPSPAPQDPTVPPAQDAGGVSAEVSDGTQVEAPVAAPPTGFTEVPEDSASPVVPTSIDAAPVVDPTVTAPAAVTTNVDPTAAADNSSEPSSTTPATSSDAPPASVEPAPPEPAPVGPQAEADDQAEHLASLQNLAQQGHGLVEAIHAGVETVRDVVDRLYVAKRNAFIGSAGSAGDPAGAEGNGHSYLAELERQIAALHDLLTTLSQA